MAPQPYMAPQPALLSLHIEVHRLLGFILRRPIREEENPSRATEPGWDSLRHVEMVFLFEDHFGMRFSEQEIQELEDARGIERIIEKRFLETPPLPQRGVEACGTA
jgi:acyl carrier protein